jgi:hypothetical protein
VAYFDFLTTDQKTRNIFNPLRQPIAGRIAAEGFNIVIPFADTLLRTRSSCSVRSITHSFDGHKPVTFIFKIWAFTPHDHFIYLFNQTVHF